LLTGLVLWSRMMAGFPWCLGVICLAFVSTSNGASPLVVLSSADGAVALRLAALGPNDRIYRPSSVCRGESVARPQ
jgi:hypothetical protein